MINRIAIAAAFLAAALLPVMVLAEMPEDPGVQCTYNGHWTYTDASEGGGPINWNLTEHSICCGLWAIELQGSGEDSYGTYSLSGECAEGQCTVNQSYESGQLQGRHYQYTGEIEWEVPLDTMAGLKGSWGEKGKGTKGDFVIEEIQCGQ
ncbi:MAG TPA: hypothetical protein DEA96_09765 [Leptospiraceae bacterium]|nr:hypothetical protein [Spirochaetaceae bacterium]HBS05241.1 hypothetical protein [Leptospiraceae bacterium]|tara:strand:- start:327412 stop:327861 length:450 start_codon:yes stop_codon:yes gene_type:complete